MQQGGLLSVCMYIASVYVYRVCVFKAYALLLNPVLALRGRDLDLLSLPEYQLHGGKQAMWALAVEFLSGKGEE